MRAASHEHGLHNPRKPAYQGGVARRHNKTQVEIEVLSLKRRMRKKQEELVEEDADYMAQHPEYPEMIGDFMQAVLAARPKNFYSFARNHFDAILATLPLVKEAPRPPSRDDSDSGAPAPALRGV